MTGFVPAGHLRVPLSRGGSVLAHRRSIATTAAFAVGAVAVLVLTVLTGPYDVGGPGGVLRVLLGGGGPVDHTVVVDQRLPRALAAALSGSALGGAGALFQSVSRNPLGSPDVVGFTTGAATGGLVAILAGTAGTVTLFVSTIGGGALTAATVALLAIRTALAGERLILGGLALGAMLAAVNDYLVSRAPTEAAEFAQAWRYGSLTSVSWPMLVPLAATLVVAVPAACALRRPLRLLELGDDVAGGLGIRRTTVRGAAIGCGVVLTGVAVATAGPVGFLALAAPHIARRCARAPGIAVGPSLAAGALILLTADLVAARALEPVQIPVGLVTAALGGLYLLWFVAVEHRR